MSLRYETVRFFSVRVMDVCSNTGNAVLTKENLKFGCCSGVVNTGKSRYPLMADICITSLHARNLFLQYYHHCTRHLDGKGYNDPFGKSLSRAEIVCSSL